MDRRVLSPLIALAVAACGEAFTAAIGDGGPSAGDGATLDTGALGPEDAGDDASSASDATSQDATVHDAMAEEGGHGKGDGSTGIVDGGPALPDAALCARTCPAGFDCIAGKCLDRAAAHFSATSNRPFNWSYGYALSQGGTFQLDTSHWTAGSTIDVWTNTAADTLEPSVFHNSGLSQQMYAEMTIPGAALGLYPSATGEPAIVRWTAPVTGLYAIDVTFTGISSPPTTVDTGVLVNNVTGMGTEMALNEFGDGNTFTFSAPAQTLMAGEAVDFFSVTIFNRDDPPGGVTLDARITAE